MHGGTIFPTAGALAEHDPGEAADIAKPTRHGVTATHKSVRYVIIVLTGMIGVFTSIGMFTSIRNWQDHVAELRLTSLAQDQLLTLNAELTDTTDLLYSMRAYFESFDHPIDRVEYQAFSRSLRERAVGLHATGWAPRVTAAGRDAFERGMRAGGWPDFQIVERGVDGKMVRAQDRPEYYPIIYSDPAPANRSVMGFDFASEPVRSRTIERAVAAAKLFVTPQLKLVNLDHPVRGMMGFIPVTSLDPPSLDQPRGDANPIMRTSSSVLGIVGGVFETASMIENILATKLHPAGLDMYVFDPDVPAASRLIYWHSANGKPVPDEATLRARHHWQGMLTLADQQWGVIFSPNDAFAAGAADWTAAAALISGLTMTVLIVGYLGFSLRRTQQLEQLTSNLRQTTDELRANGAKLDYLARHDALTGMPNRTAFRENVAGDLRRAHRGHGLAVLYLDLDRFKSVNDTLGHPAGDQLLRDVAVRLRESVREVDTITRLGGDEFAIAQIGVDQPRSAEILARRVIDALSRSYNIDGQIVEVGVSVGITLADRDDQDVDQLLHRADMALYSAKRSGRGTWRLFDSSMELDASARRGLEMDLRRALEHDEFALYYQPQVGIADGCVRGFEALLRWNHPERGLVMPGDFLRCAEETGLIVPIGTWVLKTALTDAANWPPGIRIAVNLSPYQLAHDDLAETIEGALAAFGQIGQRLELEITENALIQHYAVGQASLNRMHALGVQIAMDDFGTGYASLSQLRSFPFDRIKIDQSFVAGMTESPEGVVIVRAILQLAASLNIATTAEGVETPAQLALLAANGCLEAQGFLFSPARPASEVPRLLAGWPFAGRNLIASTDA